MEENVAKVVDATSSEGFLVRPPSLRYIYVSRMQDQCVGYVFYIITSAYGSTPVLVSRASRSALGRAAAEPGQLRPPLNINALLVNLVNIEV